MNGNRIIKYLRYPRKDSIIKPDIPVSLFRSGTLMGLKPGKVSERSLWYCMNRTISIGNQSFEKIRTGDSFYIDKTLLIKEWWEGRDDVTLVTRPRRFGKTLNLSMLECFFSTTYAGRGDLFRGLSIWEQEEYQALQGSYPVIFLSLAGVKAGHLRGAKDGIIKAVANVYDAHSYLKDSLVLTDRKSVV